MREFQYPIGLNLFDTASHWKKWVLQSKMLRIRINAFPLSSNCCDRFENLDCCVRRDLYSGRTERQLYPMIIDKAANKTGKLRGRRGRPVDVPGISQPCYEWYPLSKAVNRSRIPSLCQG